MTFDTRTVNLDALDSATKYPSIPTYHALDPKNGTLTESCVPFDGPVIATEKVDGTNGRIILMPDGSYLIGSRKEILHASGDLVHNPALGIVDALRSIADQVAKWEFDAPAIHVFYLEVYGGKVTAASKNYSTCGAVGARLFDIARIGDFEAVLSWPSERIASWRDAGGQRFFAESALQAEAAGLSGVDLTPRLDRLDADELPTDVAGMALWAEQLLPRTLVALDDSGKGRPEGIVLRTSDRSAIAKARFQDYDRTLRSRR